MIEQRRPEPLSTHEARALAVLIEKEKTVPDSYPMTLNSLLAGCNQRSNRDPVLNLSESDLQRALDGLRARGMVIESSGGRTMRYEQNIRRVLHIPSESAALLSVLMLRGPQTAAGLRAHVGRQVHFADTSSVEGFLDELASRSDGALVERMARQPGEREQRWRHLLSDDTQNKTAATPDAAAAMVETGAPERADETLRQRVEALEQMVGELNGRLKALEARCGDTTMHTGA